VLDRETAIVAALDAGADDYIVKPLRAEELLARVRALIRRGEIVREPEQQSYKVGGLKVDVKSHRVWCQKEEIELTISEFKLLHALLKNRGRVLPREQLIKNVQGDGVNVVERTVDTHVFGLRKKLGSCGEIIETVRGVGYRVGH
jgi:two-component system phosphate regulon response regulator PhoB